MGNTVPMNQACVLALSLHQAPDTVSVGVTSTSRLVLKASLRR